MGAATGGGSQGVLPHSTPDCVAGSPSDLHSINSRIDILEQESLSAVLMLHGPAVNELLDAAGGGDSSTRPLLGPAGQTVQSGQQDGLKQTVTHCGLGYTFCTMAWKLLATHCVPLHGNCRLHIVYHGMETVGYTLCTMVWKL